MVNLLEKCMLCPRKCGVNRIKGETGYCGAGSEVRIARAALHHWEEPCISGERGSGTVFFSYCPLQCVYCQNHHISHRHAGRDVPTGRLADIFLELEQQGAHNINLVTPTHYLPQIMEAVGRARDNHLSVPVVYNSSGYEEAEVVRMLEGYVDIYLPDMKYFDSQYAVKYSAAPDYFKHAAGAIAEMRRQVGTPQFGDDGMLKKGVIVRHLMLPGLLSDSKKIVRFLFETYGHDIILSLMNQYTPLPHVKAFPELDSKIRPRHYEELIDFALSLGVENAFIQEGETAEESFIPPFDGEGVSTPAE